MVRYINDAFFIWTHGKEEFESFMKELNSFSDHIKFPFHSNKEDINLLDVSINFPNGHLMTHGCIESTDCTDQKCLSYSSSNLNHIKRSLPYCQSLRSRRLHSLGSNFLKYCTKTKLWFLKKDYPENRFDEEMRKVKLSEKERKNSKGSRGVAFVVT